jgi:beta-mannosidase
MGMGHGHYVFFDETTGEEVFQWMPQRNNTAYTEFGMPAPSDADILRRIIPEEELFPPRETEAWLSHHAFQAWTERTWLCPEVIERYFGFSPDLETLVARGQWLQAEGYRCIYETARRQKPYCTMALNWCFNEPWPAAANNSIIQYPHTPKSCLHTISAACRPTLASAAFSQFVIDSDQDFAVDLWILNDDYTAFTAVRVKVTLVWDGEELDMGTWQTRPIEAATNQQGPTFRIPLPGPSTSEVAEIRLEVEERPAWNSIYRLKAGWPERATGFRAELNF